MLSRPLTKLPTKVRTEVLMPNIRHKTREADNQAPHYYFISTTTA